LIAAALIIAATAGCGYHLARMGSTLPDGVHRIAIPIFKNLTYEAGIEDTLTDALITEFLRTKWVELSSVDDADAVVKGLVKDFVTSPIAFGSTEFALEYRVSLSCRIEILDKEGKVIWLEEKISDSEEYEVTADIFQSETNKKQAVALLARDLMRQVHDQIFNGF